MTLHDLIDQATTRALASDEESKRNYLAWKAELENNLRNQEGLARQRHEQVVAYALNNMEKI